MTTLAPVNASPALAIPAQGNVSPSAASQLAKAVLLTEALQSATAETLGKVMADQQDLATLTTLQLETSALSVWTELTSMLILTERDRARDVARNLGTH